MSALSIFVGWAIMVCVLLARDVVRGTDTTTTLIGAGISGVLCCMAALILVAS